MPDNPLPHYINIAENGVFLHVKITPNAKKSAIDNIWNNTHLKISLHAPAVDGKANDALIQFLAAFLDIKKAQISLKKGEKSRLKTLFIITNTPHTIINKLPH